jgi:hypothetical protein
MADTAGSAYNNLRLRDFGQPDFKVVDIDAAMVAEGLQTYVNRGSKLTGVSLDEIELGVVKLPKNRDTVTLVELLECGMKLFDAIVWLTAGRPTSHPLSIDTSMEADTLPSLMHVARAVFYVYFFLLTQARYPHSGTEGSPPKVPNFLSTVMGMTGPQNRYIDLLCSFNAPAFDPSWAKYVSFNGLGQEALSRFGLGVAGYRYFGPFKLFVPSTPIPERLSGAFTFAQTLATKEPTWGVHPLTRDPSVLTKRGNLNKNLGNLILAIFTEEEITAMVAAKVIYAKPVYEPTATNYLTWSPVDDISGEEKIFPRSQALTV